MTNAINFNVGYNSWTKLMASLLDYFFRTVTEFSNVGVQQIHKIRFIEEDWSKVIGHILLNCMRQLGGLGNP